VPALGMGCMGLSEFYSAVDEAQALRTIQFAVDQGITFLDTADMYGSGDNELLVGRAIRGIRERIQLATKCGIVRTQSGPQRNGSPDYIRRACENSLRRLATDRIDVYYLHRVDPHTPVEESVLAIAGLVKQGKVRYAGLSKVDEATLRRANVVHPITAVQMEFSLWAPHIAGNFLELCRELDVAVVAYSPLCKGFLAGSVRWPDVLNAPDWRRKDPRFARDEFRRGLESLATLTRLAVKTQTTPAQLALAWLLHYDGLVTPLPGMRKPAHVQENLKTLDLKLTPAEFAELTAIASAYMDTQERRLGAA
jgi:aryl-alcohol dehydrogenase-like predicted oxidoreductase